MTPATGGRFSVAMAAGELRHKITIECVVEAPDSFGGVGATTVWETYKTLYAAIEPGSAREFIAAQQQSADQNTVIRCRYNDALGVTPKMRVVYQDPNRGARYYDIQGVIDIDERRRHLHLICIERGAA